MPFNDDIIGWASLGDLMQIEILAERVPAGGLVVELGSFHGRTAYAWAASVASSVTVHCIDYWGEVSVVTPENAASLSGCRLPGQIDFKLINFTRNMSEFSNVKWSRGNTLEVLPREFAAGSVDAFFVDASHSNPVLRAELSLVEALVKPGGFISGHDFLPHYPDVVAEATALAERMGRRLQHSAFEDSSIWWIDN